MTNICFSATRKFIAILILSAAVLIVTHSVYAVDSTSPGKVKRDVMREKVDEKRQLIQQRFEEKRDEIASKAAALRERLQLFKDKLKATIVQRVSDTLNRINKKQSEQMQKHLDKMSEMVTRLENRVNKEASGSGKNTASASASISDAMIAIASATAAVQNQLTKDYTINISTESAARADSRAARDKLHNDLMTVRRLAIDAKQAVANAIRVIATTLGGIKSGR